MNLYYGDELSRYIYSEDFEWQERQFLNRFLKEGDVYVDVGANIGLFTSIAAQRVGPSGRVYSFEPCTAAFHRLQENVRLNHLSNVICCQFALSDKVMQKEMVTSLDGYAAWNSFAYPIEGRMFSKEIVSCIRWDHYAREHNLIDAVAMMKIDVEGWESHVLLGAWDVLSRDDAPVLQVEFTEQCSQVAGSSCLELYRLLEMLGYGMYRYDELSNELEPESLQTNYPHLNLIAAKDLRQVLARIDRNVFV